MEYDYCKWIIILLYMKFKADREGTEKAPLSRWWGESFTGRYQTSGHRAQLSHSIIQRQRQKQKQRQRHKYGESFTGIRHRGQLSYSIIQPLDKRLHRCLQLEASFWKLKKKGVWRWWWRSQIGKRTVGYVASYEQGYYRIMGHIQPYNVQFRLHTNICGQGLFKEDIKLYIWYMYDIYDK